MTMNAVSTLRRHAKTPTAEAAPRSKGEGMTQAKSRPLPVLVLVAAVLVVASLAFPYWQLTLFAPQYPGGLHASVYLTHVGGDADEISGLNHYIGMASLTDAAPIERMLALPLVAAVLALLIASIFTPRFRLLLRLPVLCLPLGVIASLLYWLWRFGHTMDPTAPIRIPAFTPTILGKGVVMQFSTYASLGIGFWIALVAAALAIYDWWRSRRRPVAA